MPGSTRISGEAFAVERLRENPDLDYATLRRLAEAAGVNMQPIQYGRARKQLGLPPLTTRSEPRITAPAAGGPAGSAAATQATVPLADDSGAAPAPDLDVGGAEAALPRRKGSPAFDFLVRELRDDPTLLYATLRDRAAASGFRIAPIMYGRAKAVLGLVPVKPRNSKKQPAAAAPTAPRTLKQVESVAADRFQKELENVRSLEQLVAAVKELDGERRRLRDLLERIVTMIDEALG